MPIDLGSNEQEVLARVKAKLLMYVDEAAGSARTSWHAASMFRYLMRRRKQFALTRSVLHGIEGADHERVLREAGRSYLRNRELFADAPNRAALFRAWNDLLLSATAKVAQDNKFALQYAAVGHVTDDDERDWREAAERAAEERWRDT